MCLAQGHNAVKPLRLEPAASLSRAKHSTTEQLGSHTCTLYMLDAFKGVIEKGDHDCRFSLVSLDFSATFKIATMLLSRQCI